MRIKDIHKMDLPHTVIVGSGILNRITEIFRNINIEIDSTVLFSGPNIIKKLYNELESQLRERPIYIVEKASWNEVYRLERNVKSSTGKTGFMLAFGGGKTIDVTKLIAYRTKKNFVSIPTAPSHDGIASQFASIRGGERAYSYKVNPPLAVIVDMDIIIKAPKRLISSGVGDAIAKFTAVEDWRLARDELGEYYGEYSANLALLGAKLVMENSVGIGDLDYESLRTLVEALISDGVAAGIAGSSRPCSGSEHLFSHALDLYASRHALHGEQVGVGTIMMSYLHELNWKEIRDTLISANAPVNYKELGISSEDVINALILAKNIRPDRYTILHKIRVTRSKAVDIATRTKVIW